MCALRQGPHPQGSASPGKCKGQIRFNCICSIMVRTKKNQNGCHQRRFTGSKYCVCGSALPRTPLGKLTSLSRRPLAGFEVVAMQRGGSTGREGGQNGWETREKRGRKEGKDREGSWTSPPPLQKFPPASMYYREYRSDSGTLWYLQHVLKSLLHLTNLISDKFPPART